MTEEQYYAGEFSDEFLHAQADIGQAQIQCKAERETIRLIKQWMQALRYATQSHQYLLT
jgi:hypothetical protein